MLAGGRVKDSILEFWATDRYYKHGLQATDKNPAEESTAALRTVLQAEMFLSTHEERVHTVKVYLLQIHGCCFPL